MLTKSIGPEVGVYDFSEEILANDFIFSRQGMCNLVNALSSMLSNKKFWIAIYTCEPLIFTVGLANECFFIVDTHPIPTDIGGKGTGILKVFPYVTEEATACEGVCRWIWQRLVACGVNNETMQQSLSIITEKVRYMYTFNLFWKLLLHGLFVPLFCGKANNLRNLSFPRFTVVGGLKNENNVREKWTFSLTLRSNLSIWDFLQKGIVFQSTNQVKILKSLKQYISGTNRTTIV